MLTIRVEGLGKQYRVGELRNDHRTLKESLTAAVRSASTWLFSASERRGRKRRTMFWALRDVSFEVSRGDVIGIIGSNGAGKSTLLKILSRITEPTEGRARIQGRVGSLLEVGTGFHPELTGRENIFLNGAIIGMTKAEISGKFDEIVEFAEVARFIDTPVKRYSSGMYLRLAFSVAAHLEPEILIVDEVLAVGDAAFQKKCLGKMSDVADDGRTVLFVSHNLDAVQRLCSRGLLLDAGRVAAHGSVPEVVRKYLSARLTESAPGTWTDLRQADRRGTGEVRFVRARYTSEREDVAFHAYPQGPLTVELDVAADMATSLESLAVVIWSSGGVKLVNADTIAQGNTLVLQPGVNRVSLRIERLHLNPGTYRMGLWMARSLDEPYDHLEVAFQFDVVTPVRSAFGVTPQKDGVVPCAFKVRAEAQPTRS